MGPRSHKRKAISEDNGTSVNDPQLDANMEDCQPQDFVSDFHLPSRRKIRRRLMFMPHVASTSSDTIVLAIDDITAFPNNQVPPDERDPDHRGSTSQDAFIHEHTTRSEASIDNLQLETFPSRFHLPSRRKSRRTLMFMTDSAPISITANVPLEDSNMSSEGHPPLFDEACHAHPEGFPCPAYLICGDKCRKRKAPMSLQTPADSNISECSHLSKHARRCSSPRKENLRQQQHVPPTLISTNRHQRVLLAKIICKILVKKAPT